MLGHLLCGKLAHWTFEHERFGSQIRWKGHELARHLVLAYRAMGCSAYGSVPFYDLCLYGYNNDVRGYTTGQFQNRRMFATQAEYRLELRKRLGVVAFGRVGGVAPGWSDFRSDGLLPGAGVGRRFNLDKKNHINYRIDFAVGRKGTLFRLELARHSNGARQRPAPIL